MPAFFVRLAPLRHLLVRAFFLYAILRVIIITMIVVGRQLGSAPPDSPLGIVLLMIVLGVIDLRRRGELMLWANLGFPFAVAAGLYGVVALIGECSLAWMRI